MMTTFFPEGNYQDDAFIQKYLRRIRLKTAQYEVIRNKNLFSSILAEIKRLKDIGEEQITMLLKPPEAAQMRMLFKKFDNTKKE